MKKIEEEFVKNFDKLLGNQKSFEEIKDKLNLERFQKQKTSSGKALYSILGTVTAFILLAAIIIPSTIYLSSPSNNPPIGDIGDGNDKPQVVSISVNCDYGNIKNGKATLVLSAPIDIKQYKLKSKSSNQTIDNIIVGDELEVTYNEQINSSKNQVLVNTADYMIVNVDSEFPPGGGSLDIFIYIDPDEGDQSKAPIIRHSHLNYIIDENGNLINKNDGYKYDQLYAVYTKENIEENELYTAITLSAIYTCDPRNVSLDYIINDSSL